MTVEGAALVRLSLSPAVSFLLSPFCSPGLKRAFAFEKLLSTRKRSTSPTGLLRSPSSFRAAKMLLLHDLVETDAGAKGYLALRAERRWWHEPR